VDDERNNTELGNTELGNTELGNTEPGNTDGAQPAGVSPAGSERGAAASARRLPSRLVALGSAAVLTIYGTGYFKTMEAAARFAEDAMAAPGPRRAPALQPGEPTTDAMAGSSEAPGSARDRPDASAPTVDSKSGAPAGSAPNVEVSPEPDSAPPALYVPAKLRARQLAAESAAAAAPSEQGTVASASTADALAAARPTINGMTDLSSIVASAASGVSEPPVTAEPAVAVAKPKPPPPVTAPPAPKPTAKSVAPAPVRNAAVQRKWNDGTYTGWGTSRHGDIQATIVIENDVIKSAVISQCLTRYSCSWVSMLPGQVVTRQSSEVDYVSGATQSTNAFYYAVVQALGVAKVK